MVLLYRKHIYLIAVLKCLLSHIYLYINRNRLLSNKPLLSLWFMQRYPDLTFSISQNLPIIRSLLSFFPSGVSCLKEVHSDCSRDVGRVHLLARIVLTTKWPGHREGSFYHTGILCWEVQRFPTSIAPNVHAVLQSGVASLAVWQFSG